LLSLSSFLNNHLADIRLIDARLTDSVALARLPCATGAAQLIVPRPVRMVLTDPSDAEADSAVLIHLPAFGVL
jgi:hypothetical protein